MRLAVSDRLCTGHGRCYSMAPEVYEADDEGYSAARGGEIDVAPGLEDRARLGMSACPEGAITLVVP